MTDESRMSGIERRLRRAEAALAIMQIEGEYARSWDAVDAAGWAGLFVADGVFEIESTGGRPPVRHEGRAALEAFCRETNARFRGVHMSHTPALVIEDERATSKIHYEFSYYQEVNGGHEHTTVTGIYDVVYVLEDSGWRIGSRVERAISRRHAAFYPGYYASGNAGSGQ